MTKYYTIKLTEAQLEMAIRATNSYALDLEEGVRNKIDEAVNDRVYDILLKVRKGIEDNES
mgnify:CR=1 FL=1